MKTNQNGFVMVMSMVTLLIITVMGIGGLMITGFQQDTAGRLRCRSNSLRCAEIGKSMILGRYNPHVDTGSFPFPSLVDTSLPTACSAIFVGHLMDRRDPSASEEIGWIKDLVCTNNVGCKKSTGGNFYRTTIVAQAENCSPVEIEFIVNTAF